MNYDYVLRILTVQVTTNLKKTHLLTLVFFAIYAVVLANSESYKIADITSFEAKGHQRDIR